MGHGHLKPLVNPSLSVHEAWAGLGGDLCSNTPPSCNSQSPQPCPGLGSLQGHPVPPRSPQVHPHLPCCRGFPQPLPTRTGGGESGEVRQNPTRACRAGHGGSQGLTVLNPGNRPTAGCASMGKGRKCLMSSGGWIMAGGVRSMVGSGAARLRLPRQETRREC